MFRFWKSKSDRKREGDQMLKLASGQQAMLSALTSTTEAADGLLEWFRKDAAQSLDHHPEDALLLCNLDGIVARGNVGATSLFLTNTTRQSIKDFLIPELILSEAAQPSRALVHGAFDPVWRKLFANPPKAKICMTALRENGERFAVEVAITRLDHLIDAPKLLFLIRDPAESVANAPVSNIFDTLSTGVDHAMETLKARTA